VLDLETFASRAQRVYKPSSLRRKLKVLALYDEFLKRNKLSVGVESLAKWMDELGKRVSPSTLGAYARDVLSYFQIMLMDLDERKLKSLKMMIPSIAASLKPAERLTVEEVRRLIENSRYPHRLIYSLCYAYGRRLSEVLNATVDLKGNTITFPILKRKAGEMATFNLEPWIRSMIEEYLKMGFGTPNKLFDLTDRAVEIAFKRDCERVGIKPNGRKLRVHLLRHSIITHLIERGVPIEIVSKYLARHRDVRTTFQFYVSATEEMSKQLPKIQELLWGEGK